MLNGKMGGNEKAVERKRLKEMEVERERDAVRELAFAILSLTVMIALS